MKAITRMFAALALGMACMGHTAFASSGPVRLVIFAAGGPVDIVARQLAEKLSSETGSEVIVDPRPGANGIIAAQNVVASKGDGTTLLFSSSGLFTISPTLQELPFDIDKDLKPVSRVVVNASAVAIDARIPADNVAEFIEYARSQSRPVAFGSPGMGNITQLWIEQFKEATGLNLLHVPYKGIAPALVDVMGGRLAGTIGDMPAFLPHISAGKVKVIGLVGEKRSPAVSHIPTVLEQGFPGVEAVSWYALFAPGSTPDALIARMADAVNKALSDDGLRERLRSIGVEPSPTSPEELAAIVRTDRQRWAKVIRDRNISIK